MWPPTRNPRIYHGLLVSSVFPSPSQTNVSNIEVRPTTTSQLAYNSLGAGTSDHESIGLPIEVLLSRKNVQTIPAY